MIRILNGETFLIKFTPASAFSGDAPACLDTGMDEHVGKPALPGELFATLDRFLHGKMDMDHAAAQ